MLTATELAGALGYSKGRISQLVASGQLAGCWRGEGRGRRFDLAKSAAALNVRLDPGQQTGNGVRHLERRARLGDGPDHVEPIENSDARRLARARADAAEVAARQKAREEAETVGRYVLADEHRRACRAMVAHTVASAERVLVDEVRRLARDLGANPAEAVAAARAAWRKARAAQARALGELADAAAPTETEAAEMATA